MKIFIYLVSFILTTLIYSKTFKVAIVGSGIGGSSAAYYLLNNTNFLVDMYEKEFRVGGRIYSHVFLNSTEELGALFFIKESELLYSIIKDLQVPYESTYDATHSSSVIFRNKTILFELNPSNFVNLFNLFWNYGLSPFYSQWLLYSNFIKFSKIYDVIKDRTKTFNSVEELLDLIDLKDLVTQSIEDYLLNNSISQKYIDEYISAIIGGIYHQHKEANTFASFTSLAGIGYQSYKIKGGNTLLIKSILEKLKKIDRFNLYLNAKVKEITKREDGQYELKTKGKRTALYDYIIIASPVEKTTIQFNNINIAPRNRIPKEFQSNYQTLVRGEINPAYFGLKQEEFPKYMSTFSANKTESFGISDILLIHQTFNDSTHNYTYYYKIQADTQFSKEYLEKTGMFKEGFEVLWSHHWEFAYPKLTPLKIEELPDFKLDDKIFHVNAIESVAPFMEFSVISAKNIVKIIEKETNSAGQVTYKKKELKKDF